MLDGYHVELARQSAMVALTFGNHSGGALIASVYGWVSIMPRRLSRPARQVWRFGKAFASTGAERTKVREQPRAAKTKPKPKIAGRAGSLRYRGWGEHSMTNTRETAAERRVL